MSSPPPTPNVGRFTAVILGLVVFVCVTMIGGTGYLKYQLDRTESVLAAPDNALGGDQDMFDRLRRDLGYGGFLGLAQNYAMTHDASGFSQMKTEIKSADDIVAHLPDKTTSETRHELASIVTAFDNAFQKIDAPVGSTTEFSTADLGPLYAAVPILDARVSSANGETRLIAQNKMQFWAMLLTLVSWCSLIIAAACAAGIYLTLRDKHSAPMRALAQSVQNMARGDMRTAIWGIERQDMIGELARAVDLARYHFSHLPDLSLLSEQGPVRMRFEGGTRSLFEAMMRAISRDSENIRSQSAALSETVTNQQTAITTLSAKVENVLQSILQRGLNGDQQIRDAIRDMTGSAEGLKNAHAHAADQLNRLIPQIQDRAKGLAEIAHITGKQIGTTLQALSASELGLKTHSDQVKETLSKISTTADDLGERLFGAINLLQASGKVLAETTEDIKGRFSNQTTVVQDISLAPLSNRLEQITQQLSLVQMQLDQRPAERAAAPIYSPTPSDIPHDASLTNALAELNDKITAITTRLPAEIRNNLRDDLEKYAAHAAPTMTAAEGAAPASYSPELESIKQQLLSFEQTLFTTLHIVETTQSELKNPSVKPTYSLSADIQKQLMDQWFQMSAQIEATRASVVDAIASQIDQMESRIADRSSTALSRTATDYNTQRQIEQQTAILSELVATLSVLDTHMQQIKLEMHATGTK